MSNPPPPARRRGVAALVLSLVGTPLAATAVTERDFYVKDAQDLVDLCTAEARDEYATAAIHHFCQSRINRDRRLFQQGSQAGSQDQRRL